VTAVLFVWALLGVTPAGAVTSDALTATETGEARRSPYGAGVIVTGGYFFKDTLFYSGGRGGPHLAGGRALALTRWLGLWIGAGALAASGTQNVQADGGEVRSRFEERLAYVEAGVITPWFPLPVALALYGHETTFAETGLGGAAAGRALSGVERGVGVGVVVHLVVEHFFSDRRDGPRGVGLVAGYTGLMELSPVQVRTRDAAGFEAGRTWKPFKGESLRLGLEYEF
jgi:hypothetical protein